jgi:transcriptional regulator with XRE-family HTH domain
MIGKRIKELRSEQKISMTELSKKSGVQLATLSRIENQKMTGTLESHMQIAQALGVGLPDLYQDVEAPASGKNEVDIRIKEANADIFNYREKSSYEILTNKLLNKKMMPILLKIDAGGRTNTEQGKPGSEKFVFVLEGHIKVSIAEKTYVLGPNNTLYFDSSLPHMFINEREEAAKIISIMTPVEL